jgi:UDPglucose 6-dehydrogenase
LSDKQSFIQFKSTAAEAMAGADAVVVCTEWPEFRALDWPALVATLRRPLVIDATRFLEKSVAGLSGLHYVTVGSPE